MIAELREGIEGSGIRAGAIGEIGTEGEEFLPAERANFVAAAYAQRETGVAILTHTPAGRFGVEQATLLIEHGAEPGRICIGHVDCHIDHDYYAELVDLGVWLGFDRAGVLSYAADEERWAALQVVGERGWLDRVVISGDVARPSRFLDGSGAYRYAFTAFSQGVGALRDDDNAYHMVYRDNPRLLLGHAGRPPAARFA
jgi:phosphotriesterase-related protein